MEIPTQEEPYASVKAFRSYLRGMETGVDVDLIETNASIPILPTRHGNQAGRTSLITYKSIPILPTRHGNPFNLRKVVLYSSIPILPTRHGNSADPYKFDCDCWIPILPMRHGNESVCQDSARYRLSIPILPMRHGNEEFSKEVQKSSKEFRSYL